MALTAADLEVKFRTTGADKVSGEVNRVNRGIMGLGRTAAGVAGGFILGNILQSAGRMFAGAAASGLEFEKQMANVNSIAQVTTPELKAMSEAVLQLAGDPRVTDMPATLAAGLYDISSSGFAGADAMNILEKAAIAGTAGLTGTDVAARAITASLNAYGLGADQAGRVSDVLFETVNRGVLTFDQLANNLGNVLPIAASLGVGIEEVGAAYAQMTLSGVSASQAETQIASLMRSALNPTEKLTAAVQEHGYASAANAIEQEGLAGFLDIVNEAAGGNQETMMDLLGTQEAMNAATILGKNNTDDYREALKAMNEASADGGATQRALAKQMESASFQLTKLRQTAQIFAARLMGFLAPAIGAVARGLTSLMTRGLIPFTDLVARALGGSFRFKEVLDDIPAPLREFARGVGVVLEGIGDLAEFMLAGDWSRVAQRLPGELRQILGGLSVIGDELAAGVRFVANIVIDSVVTLAGWLYEHAGDIWNGIKTLAGWTVDRFDEAISATITGALSLAGDLADAAGDLWGWVKRKLGFGGGVTVPGLFGGTTTFGGQELDVGVVTVLARIGEIVTSWAGDVLGNLATDVSAWLTAHEVELTSLGVNVNEITPTLDAAAVGDFGDAVKAALTADPIQITPKMELNIQQGVADWVAGGFTGMGVPDWAPVAVAFIGQGPLGLAGAINAKITQVVAPDIARGLWAAITGAFEGLFRAGSAGAEISEGLGAGGVMAGAVSEGLLAPIISAITQELAGLPAKISAAMPDLSGALEPLTTAFDGAKRAVAEAIARIGEFSGVSIDIPDVSPLDDVTAAYDAVREAITKAWGWITSFATLPIGIPDVGPLDDVVGAFTAVKDAIQDAIDTLAFWNSSDVDDKNLPPVAPASKEGDVELPQQFLSRRGGGLAGALAGAMGPVPPLVIPAPDTSAFDAGLAAAAARVATFAAQAGSILSAFAGVAGTYAAQAGQQVTAGLTAGMASATAAVVSGAATMGATLMAFAGVAGTAGQIAGQQFAAGVAAGMGQAIGAAAAGVGAILSILAGASAGAFAAGAAIGAGLAAGINAQVGAVQAAAANLANAAASATASALQIQSPSRVFAYYGRMTAQGFALGMERETGRVLGATAQLLGTPTAQRGGIRASGGGARTVHITVNGAADPQATWRVLDRELAARGL
jgi:TP901 family phage tail tape measure protein